MPDRRNPFDPDAPVVVQGEVTVHAPRDRVWRLLTEVDRWNRWNRGIDFAALGGDVEPGARLHWRADGMNLRSVLDEAEPPHRLSWTSRTLGAVSYHRWSLEALPGGGTRVVSQESWDGLMVKVLRRTLRRTLQRSRTHWLGQLKREAERTLNDPAGSEQELTTGNDE